MLLTPLSPHSPPDTVTAIVRQNAGTITVDYGADRIGLHFRECESFQLLPTDFALWMLLPLAMRQRRHLHVAAAVDPASLENARHLARIWSMWLPDVYGQIAVTADEVRPSPAATSDTSLLLYSGGVDSTYALLTRHRSHSISNALTVHGLDYHLSDQDAFDRLIGKTDPLLSVLGVNRLVVRTDAGQKIRDLGLTHGFVLASCLFLFANRFKKGHLAADLTPEQDMMVFPWGTNHVTNPYFASSTFSMETLSHDQTRIAKLDYILNHPIALRAVSFCGNRRFRPHNCGVCPKCLRTKTMFLALIGECPGIFLDNSLTESQVQRLDVASNAAYKHYAEIVRVARERGFLNRIPGLERQIDRAIAAKRRRNRMTRYLDEAARVMGLT